MHSLVPLPCCLLASVGLQCSPMLLVKPAWRTPPLLIVIISVATAAFTYMEERCSESNYAFLAASSVEVEGLFFLSPSGKLVTHLCLLFISCPSAICFNLAEGDGREAGKPASQQALWEGERRTSKNGMVHGMTDLLI